MGVTRLASGKMQCSYTMSKGSQTAQITLMSVSLCHKNPDNAGRVALSLQQLSGAAANLQTLLNRTL